MLPMPPVYRFSRASLAEMNSSIGYKATAQQL